MTKLLKSYKAVVHGALTLHPADLFELNYGFDAPRALRERNLASLLLNELA